MQQRYNLKIVIFELIIVNCIKIIQQHLLSETTLIIQKVFCKIKITIPFIKKTRNYSFNIIIILASFCHYWQCIILLMSIADTFLAKIWVALSLALTMPLNQFQWDADAPNTTGYGNANSTWCLRRVTHFRTNRLTFFLISGIFWEPLLWSCQEHWY